MKITKPQIKKFHTLLSKNNMMPYKREIIFDFTGGRTNSTLEMNQKEAKEVIKYLLDVDFEKHEKLINKLFSTARKIGFIYGYSKEDNKMNLAKMNAFLRDRGTIKKPINELTVSELRKVVGQFEAMRKSKEKTVFNKELKEMLSELNIG